MELENVLYKLKDYARDLQSTANSASTGGRSRGDMADLDVDDLQLTASAKTQQQSGGASKSRVPLATSQQDLSSTDDVSLKEALEYLVSLAKQRKLERRDHDIPYPLVDREGK